MLHVAAAYRNMRAASALGLTCTGTSFDWKKVGGGRQQVVSTITGENGERYLDWAKEKKIEIRRGVAVFVRPTVVEVDGISVEGKAFVLATGSQDRIPDIHGLTTIPFLTSREAWQLDRVPKSMAIIGGGPVGCELATCFASFGTRVVLVESAPTVLPREETELAALAQEALTGLGVEVVVGAKVLEAINARGGVYGLKIQTGATVTTHAVDIVVVAVGRQAQLEGLGLKMAGVAVDAQGFVSTNGELRTSAKHIWAAGNIKGGMILTQVARAQGVVAGSNAGLSALGKRGAPQKMQLSSVPHVTFVSPELASVGETVAEARGRLKKVLVGRAQTSELVRAIADRSTHGQCIVVAHPRSRKILGCHMLAPHAGEVIHEAALAMRFGATANDILQTLHAFPTYNELLSLAVANLQLE
jgi:pyruvate/2-oxoglutarate dehydrogenase complex dihydrolipoamide dehydrogenase (E3) component